MSSLQNKDTWGNDAGDASSGTPDPELLERAQRRRFTAAYKLGVLREADGLLQPGEIGALLRREGLYSSHLAAWRRQREAGSLEALARPRGHKPADPLAAQNAELQRRLTRSESDLEQARRVIEAQGNVCALLGELHGPRGANETASSDA